MIFFDSFNVFHNKFSLKVFKVKSSLRQAHTEKKELGTYKNRKNSIMGKLEELSTCIKINCS